MTTVRIFRLGPMVALTLTLGALLAAAPLAQGRAELALKAAMDKEVIDGDLKSAIAEYKKVVANAGTNRALAAQALVRMAACHEKLGDGQARAVYEQIVRDFSDQRDALAVARAHLAKTEPPVPAAGMMLRKVWAGARTSPDGSISADGRFLTFTDWETGDLAVRELSTGTDRRLTNKGSWAQSEALAEDSVVSRDGRYVAYGWCDCSRYSLRTIALTEDGAVQPRVLFASEAVAWIAPYDWSPDGNRIAVQIRRHDQKTSQIGWVAVDDGSLHVLKSIDWRVSLKLSFSPDGRFIAYDLPTDDNGQRDVYVIAVDGSRETVIASSPGREVVLGWSPDGARLLFASDRSGAAGMWAQPMAGGQPAGTPELIKSDLGDIGQRSLGITAAGSLYLAMPIGGIDVYIASINVATGQAVAAPTKVADKLVGFNRQPDWSPDGKLLAYISSRGRNGRDTTAVTIYAPDSRKLVRELQVPLTYAELPRWTPDGKALVVYGWDLKGNLGIFRIDAQTGTTSAVAYGDMHGPQMLADGKTIVATLYGEPPSIVAVDGAAGTSMPLLERADLSVPALSPDGRFVAFRTSDRATRSSAVMLLDVTSRQVRELARLQQPQAFAGQGVSWTADGRALIARRTAPGGPADFVLIPVAGGEPRTLEIPNAATNSPVRPHPDHARIAYTSGQSQWEIWVLENFLPSSKSSRP